MNESLPIALKVARSGRGSDLYSTFVAADDTPPADSTPTNLTFTLKDADDVAIIGAVVTYA